ncbi:transposable element Tc3 transposase [Trichonephila clavipes]|nr:transposable element Tc3 transposase [Trichonephila clavipes]
MESDSGRLLIWREQRTRYHQSNTVERHSYRGGGILVWAGISLGGHTDLHVFHGGTVTGLRYRDEILDPYVRPYAAAIGNDFILMDDNARPHRAGIVEEYLKDHVLERMEWPARSPDLNPIEHLWDYLGREVAALNPPPRSLHELKQGLLCVWSSLPIPVSDNLINSMGNRCRQCIQWLVHVKSFEASSPYVAWCGSLVIGTNTGIVTGSRVFSLICRLGSLGPELMATLFQPNPRSEA